jgi:dTMP kinase
VNQIGRGRLITLEGVEGAGKSTNLAYLERLLSAAGRPPLLTREPGGTELGEAVRDLLLGHRHAGMGSDSELLLMFAARAENLAKRVRPALAKGQWVLCDRFTDASYAYQGGGRGISPARIRVLEQWVHADLQPDLTLLLDLPVEQGLERAVRRSHPDRFEAEKRAFFERVRRVYLERARAEPKRIRVIDARSSLETVQSQLRLELDALLRSDAE